MTVTMKKGYLLNQEPLGDNGRVKHIFAPGEYSHSSWRPLCGQDRRSLPREKLEKISRETLQRPDRPRTCKTCLRIAGLDAPDYFPLRRVNLAGDSACEKARSEESDLSWDDFRPEPATETPYRDKELPELSREHVAVGPVEERRGTLRVHLFTAAGVTTSDEDTEKLLRRPGKSHITVTPLEAYSAKDFCRRESDWRCWSSYCCNDPDFWVVFGPERHHSSAATVCMDHMPAVLRVSHEQAEGLAEAARKAKQPHEHDADAECCVPTA